MQWAPTTIYRVIHDPVPSSTSPSLVDTDRGQGFVKVLGNPEGPHALVSEYVGTCLAGWMKLPTFDHAIIQITQEDEIVLTTGQLAQPGPAFITRKEDGESWSGERDELKAVTNIDIVSRLVVFDTWIRNRDRYMQEGLRIRRNERNVFLSAEGAPSGKVLLKAIDHTHCFSDSNTLSKKLAHIDTIQDSRTYGLFPEFRPFLNRQLLAEALDRLSDLKQSVIEAVVAEVPSEWDLDRQSQDALLDFIVRRAEFVANTIEGRLFPQAELFE